MRRIQGSFGQNMPEDEKKRVRQDVINNFVLFGLIVGVIRIGQFYTWIRTRIINVYVKLCFLFFSAIHCKQCVADKGCSFWDNRAKTAAASNVS